MTNKITVIAAALVGLINLSPIPGPSTTRFGLVRVNIVNMCGPIHTFTVKVSRLPSSHEITTLSNSKHRASVLLPQGIYQAYVTAGDCRGDFQFAVASDSTRDVSVMLKPAHKRYLPDVYVVRHDAIAVRLPRTGMGVTGYAGGKELYPDYAGKVAIFDFVPAGRVLLRYYGANYYGSRTVRAGASFAVLTVNARLRGLRAR